MARYVHITNPEAARSIERSGIRLGRHSQKVWLMPHTADFFSTHQWARELVSRAPGRRVAVDVKLPNDELVLFGRYNGEKMELTAAAAVGALMELASPLGYEVILTRKIQASEVVGTRSIPFVGWRHYPGAHGHQPCPNPCCNGGEYKSADIRRRLQDEYDKEDPYPTVAATPEGAVRLPVPSGLRYLREPGTYWETSVLDPDDYALPELWDGLGQDLPDALRVAVLRYMEGAPVIRENYFAQWEGPGVPEEPAVRSDGRWIWSDALTHGVREYGAALNAEFLAHVQTVGGPPMLDPSEIRYLAKAFRWERLELRPSIESDIARSETMAP